MKASEFRIGNLLYDSKLESIMIVSSLESDEYTSWNSGDEFHVSCLRYGTKDGYFEGNDFEPIKLTEDWFLRLGFEKGIDWNKKTKFTNKSFHVGLDERTEKYFVMLFVGAVDVEFVHQLQNLYFAHTGEELEF